MVDNRSDEDLLDQYFAGDAEAFRSFYRRHAGRVLGYAQAKGLNAQAAEEVRQESFLRLHHSIHRYESGRPALPWFFTIVHNCVIDIMRQNQSLMKMKQEWQNRTEVTTSPEEAETEPGSAAMLASLSAEQRQVVELRVFQEKSFKEMAQTTGKSEVALRKIYERARQKLRRFGDGGDNS
ncbi:RNA polymerase sigma factor [Oligoflexus tunisiensis]|uniref:RNA polymerase sigma factor n=1 Tax=Oligoflexus tunisiensis TaxID=708132 RepID=UPI001C405D51|nr:RNA polymerase sigma factor [Oligoflexus tunisiensis]